MFPCAGSPPPNSFESLLQDSKHQQHSREQNGVYSPVEEINRHNSLYINHVAADALEKHKQGRGRNVLGRRRCNFKQKSAKSLLR